MTGPEKSESTRAFNRVVTYSAAVGMGLSAAFLYSLKQVNPELKVEFTSGTVVAFVIAAALTAAFFRILLGGPRRGAAAHGRPKKLSRKTWLLLFVLITAILMIFSFVIAMRNVSHEKQMEVLAGALIAIAVLSLFGFLFSRIVRFLERDSHRNAEEDEGNPGISPDER